MISSKSLIVFLVMATVLTTMAWTANLNVVSEENVPSAPLPATGDPVDEVVVESSLYIKPKPKTSLRRTRRSGVFTDSLLASYAEHKRVKRAVGHQQQRRQTDEYGQSQAAANAAANNHYRNPNGFGNSAANAQSQAFNAHGPAGSFGASSAGTVTQALNANRFGQQQNSAGASLSQSYVLPNGQTISFAGTNSFANGGASGNNANSRGGAISVSRG